MLLLDETIAFFTDSQRHKHLKSNKHINSGMKVGQDYLKTLTPRPYTVRKILGYLAMFVFSLLTKTTVRGRHHLPKKGPFIIVVNHFSLIDGSFLVFVLRRPIIFLMASDQMLDWQYIWAPWLYGLIALDRQKLAPSVIKKSINVLKNGEILVIFPEGNSLGDVLRPAKNGAAYLSTITQTPIIPVGLAGTGRAWPSLFRGVRPRVTIHVGKAFGPVNLKKYGSNKGTALTNVGVEIMCRIAALLPQENHGEFRGRPEIKEYKKDSGY